jgi:signal transduction histidine kinase
MDQVIRGVSKLIKKFSLSNYSLTSQIILINFSTAFLAFIFLILFNCYLILTSKNLDKEQNNIQSILSEITNHLSQNAVKRIFTFDDNCIRILREGENNYDCDAGDYSFDYEVRIENKPPALDPTYTQKYIYSNFLNSFFEIKVIADSWIKFADTNDFYGDKDEIIILDVNSKPDNKLEKNKNFYYIYKEFYFNLFNGIKKFFDEKKLNQKNIKNIKNDNTTVKEIIKTKLDISYIYKDEEVGHKAIFASPILKNNKVFGVVIIDTPINFKDNEIAAQSILLTNFFLFFISIMLFLSLLFSRSIVKPIKILSYNTQLERNKFSKNKKTISYPDRKDEIGTLSNDIKNMSNDLKKRINQIEEFSADVSHELKNPLTALKSSGDLLKTNKLDNDSQKLLISNMVTDIDRMNILISDIANYTLTEVEISEEVFEEIELINLLDKFKNSFSNKNYSLVIQNNKKSVFLKINKNKFLQVLYNLFDNSSNYIEINSEILIFVEIKDKQCIIHFVDQGPGIDLSYKDKIFERFYTDRIYDGKSHSGLGLSISKNIIESFGGNINLIKSNHFGFNGACFEIKLPLKD